MSTEVHILGASVFKLSANPWKGYISMQTNRTRWVNLQPDLCPTATSNIIRWTVQSCKLCMQPASSNNCWYPHLVPPLSYNHSKYGSRMTCSFRRHRVAHGSTRFEDIRWAKLSANPQEMFISMQSMGTPRETNHSG